MGFSLSADDQQRISRAVAEAERRTSGEIVPYVVARSGTYEAAIWRGGVLFALIALAGVLLFLQFYAGWGWTWLHTGWGSASVMLAAGVVGAALAAYVPGLKRLLIRQAEIERTVHLRAMQAFVEEEVFNTRERTGILLFISLFEHWIEVEGDSGINKLVTDEDWVHVVECVRDGIKRGDFAGGLIEGVGLCGALLEKSGVEIRADDTNELSDAVRIRKSD
jgi:putative membrane protein